MYLLLVLNKVSLYAARLTYGVEETFKSLKCVFGYFFIIQDRKVIEKSEISKYNFALRYASGKILVEQFDHFIGFRYYRI